jgi:dienelactone hydrolase
MTTHNPQVRRGWSSRWSAWPLAVLIAIGVAALVVRPAGAATDGGTSRDVTFTGGGGIVLHGTVLAPASGGRRPGMVLLGGAGGPGKRAEYLPEAEAFARRGVVTFVYDKRAAYLKLQQPYSALADDAVGAVRVLRTDSAVDPGRVGLWGQSEGAWIASLAASRSPGVAFLVTVGAVGVSPGEQTGWANANDLRHAGVAGSLLPTVQSTATRLAIGAGMFPAAGYDPVPAWEQVHQPVLALWGADDQVALPEESSRIIRSALDRAGNAHYTMRFIANASHSLHVSHGGGFEGGSLLTTPIVTPLAPGYPDLVTSWIGELAHGLPATSVQPAPHLSQQSTSLPPLRWYEAPWVLFGALVLFVVAFGGHLVARALWRRRSDLPVRRPAMVLAVTGLATAVGLYLYLAFLLETGGNVVGPVVAGRPLPWLALQLASLAALVATVAVAVRWWPIRRDTPRCDRVRLGLLLAAGVVLAPWAVYWGLLVA